MVTALLFSLVPVLAAAISGGVAALRTPGPRLTSGLQHFAAGVAVMLGFRAISERLEHRRETAGETGLTIGLGVATAVDSFVDGVILAPASRPAAAWGCC